MCSPEFGRMRIALIAVAAVWLSSVDPLRAEIRTLVLGPGGIPWDELGERVVGLETVPGNDALQPLELLPQQNIIAGPRTDSGEYTTILGSTWQLGKQPKRDDFELGVTPRFWTSILPLYHTAPFQVIDGDRATVTKLRWSRVGEGRREDIYTFDFAFPIPINRVVFYPPATGLDESGGLRKQRFPRAYEISGVREPVDFLLLSEEDRPRTLERVLSRTFVNSDRVIDVRFPAQILRFLRLSFNLIEQVYMLSEIEVYGEGFAPETSYRTSVIDLGAPVNFGRIFWQFETFRKTPSEPAPTPAPDAPIRLVLETRTGKDDTPKAHYIVSDIGTERKVEEAVYNKALEKSPFVKGDRPGDKSSIQLDEQNWSFWSTPYDRSGQLLRSPDARRYIQLQFNMVAEDFHTFGQVQSAAIEYSPLLVESLVGEVGLAGGGDRIPEVPAGRDTTFIYDLLARFGPAGQLGFDAIKLNTSAEAELVKLEIGQPLAEVVPDSVRFAAGVLAVYFPSHKVVRAAGEERLRLTFRTALLDFTTHFLGEVFALAGEHLPQSIDPGDASAALHSDDVRAFATGTSLTVLSALAVTPSVLTPNGDRVNDELDIAFTLLGIEATATEIGVYTLAGQRVRALVRGAFNKGLYREQWDGRDDQGVLVPPGLYLLRVTVDTDEQAAEQFRPVSVAY